MSIDKVGGTQLEFQRIISDTDAVDGVDYMILEAMSDKVSVLQSVKAEIQKSLLDPTLTSDPATLAAVQAMLADYQLNIELYSKIASSLLKNVDTLVKS